jgi:hypothetical protein
MNIRAISCVAALIAAIASAQPAAAQANVKIGALRCEVSAGLGLIVASSKEMRCNYRSLHGFRERYYGTIKKFGLDIGQTNNGVLAWDVLAPTMGPRRGALAGDYIGASASATVGAGVGANALIGGFGKSITLQPLSLETQTGLALAAGVAELTLRAGR